MTVGGVNRINVTRQEKPPRVSLGLVKETRRKERECLPPHLVPYQAVVSDEFTVVGLYHFDHGEGTELPERSRPRVDLIKQLCAQAYEYADIRHYDGLEANLRVQLEALNSYRFSDEEWKRFCKSFDR